MNDERLAELKEKYKDRNLLEELAWGIYADHSGYTSKQDGEFLNWLCLMAYKALKEKPQGDLISRDALKKTIKDIVDQEIKEDRTWAIGLRHSLSIIDNAPTISPYKAIHDELHKGEE